jgi:hypothetical protein
MKILRRSLFPAMLCVALTIPLRAQQRTIGVPAADPSGALKIVGDRGPQAGIAASSQDSAALEFAVVRQGPSFQTRLTDRPQKVLFVKSQASNAKAAIGNLLLSDVGLTLITMALAPQLRMWNPYMNDSIRKGLDLGKGMLVGHGSDTKGFEYDTLPGATAEVTLKEGPAEFLVPMNNYVPSADFDAAGVQPILVRLEPRDRDNARLITSRQVILKQNKTGRFDLKPTVERQESGVEQNLVLVSVERLPGNVVKVSPNAPLAAGEYGLVFRRASDTGDLVQNVPLRPTPPTPADSIGQGSAKFGAMAGSGTPPAQAAPSRSPFGMMHRGSNPPASAQNAAAAQPGTAGFIAWDFRVLK